MTRRAFLPLVQNGEYAGSPSAGVYLGVWVRGLQQDMSVITSLQDLVGTRMAIVQWYDGWSADPETLFNQATAEAVSSQGSVPLVTWEPWTPDPANGDAQIAAGKFDDYVVAYAQGIKSYGKPVFLRFGHEMNNSAYPWAVGINGNTAQDYVDAWRHVHDVFTSVGVTNALWVWSPNVGGTLSFDEIHTVYPGDAYVDWMGLDGYNGGTALPWGGWLSFANVFGDYYQALTQISDKPLMIAETGSVEQGGSKAAWITDAMLTQLPQNFPRIRAFIWFNEDWRYNAEIRADFRIESSQSSLDAYRQAAANPYFRSSYP